MLFDIQKFAEEEVQNYGDILDGTIEESTEELPPIPEELSGIPEDIARDVMKKAAEISNASKPAEGPQTETPAETKTDDAETAVPYKRFKEIIDQKNELAQQIAAYRERYGDISQSQAPAQNQPPQEMPVQNAPQFNAEVIKQIDDTITQRAMAISGLSKEDVESMDYFEDGDPRIALWQHARKLSEASVYNDIIANHVAQQQELQRMQYLQNQSVNDYNNYVAQKQADENFDAVRQFATGEFFNAQSPIDKEIITSSFARLRRNQASPADMMIVRDYFNRAENAFARKNRRAAEFSMLTTTQFYAKIHVDKKINIAKNYYVA
ncbi:MAG: hypothetical protein IJU91_10805 [Selenomonadaceae bacterium]|nr:hypothetical protein [Selenomonadaceae bacterium]